MSFYPARPHPSEAPRDRATQRDGRHYAPQTPYPFVDTLFDYLPFVKAPRIGNVSAPEPPRVGIVGAGIAGLAAAYELMKAGVRPTLYEAAKHEVGPLQGEVRIGGRCYSKPFFQPTANGEVFTGYRAELGAMRVPVSCRTFFHYADLFGLRYGPRFPDPGLVPTLLNYRGNNFLWTPSDEPPFYGLPVQFQRVHRDWSAFVRSVGDPVVEDLVRGDLEGARAKWQALIDEYKDVSFFGALRRLMPDWQYPEDFDLFGALGIGSGGFGPLFQVGFLEILRLMVNGLEIDQLFVESTTGALAEGFYTHVPAGGTPFGEKSLRRLRCVIPRRVIGVEAMPRTPRARLHFEGAPPEEFDAVIVATSTRAMQVSLRMTSPAFRNGPAGMEPAFSPAIGPDVQAALRELHLMNSSKMFILTERKFWKGTDIPETVQTDQLPRGVYLLDYPSEHYPDYGVVCVSYTWGDDSTKLLAETPLMERLAILREAIAGIQPDLAAHLLPAHGEASVYNIDWQATDLHHGAFKLNYPGQDHRTRDAYYQFLECLDSAHDQRVFLAGDSVSWTGGWIEGALHTALNAAAAVIHKLRGELAAGHPLSQDRSLYDYDR